VRVTAKGHPILVGIEPFEADDELYAKLVGDAPIDVLLEADSDWSGRTEPIAWVRRYGEGRVFVTVLGHDVRSREIPAVRRLFRQGVEWAAGD
jgi:type 1 glutamine amidotransferase